jgi:hypothetical protein
MAPANERPDREIDMTEFPTARAAIAHARDTGARALRMGGRTLVVSRADAEWLEMSGAVFAYLHEVQGRLVTVPVND